MSCAVRYHEAHPFLVQAVLLNPINVPAYNNLGVVYEKTGHLQQALELYSTAVLLQPSLVETYNNIAHIHTMLAQPREAIKNYLHAFSMQVTVHADLHCACCHSIHFTMPLQHTALHFATQHESTSEFDSHSRTTALYSPLPRQHPSHIWECY